MKAERKETRYPSLEQRIELLKFIRDSCVKGRYLNNYLLKTRFNTSQVLPKLLGKKIIKETGSTGIFTWQEDLQDESMPGIAAKCWFRNGKASKQKFPIAKNVTLSGVKEQGKLYNDVTADKFLSLLDESITLAVNYGVTNYAAYITHYIKDRINKH